MNKNTRTSGILLLVIIIFLNYHVVAGESSVNQPPEAYFVASPSSGQEPLTVNFDASGSVDMDGKIESYAWDFGDGKSGSKEKVSYTYKKIGNYDAILTVTDDRGETGRYSIRIKVSSGDSLEMTIISDPVAVGPEKPSEIRVNVARKDGAGIADAKVTLSSTGGKIDPISGNTDASGQFSSSFTAPEGKYRISATATKGVSQGSGETMVRVLKLTPIFVKIFSTPESITPGGSSSIRVEVKGSDGSPVSNAMVKLILIPGQNGTVDPASGITDSGGKFISTFTDKSEGTVSIKANVAKGFSDSSGDITVDVRPGNNLLFIPVFILIIVVGVFVLEFWVKGKLQLVPLMTSIPCDGKSTLPIRVQFVDPSGKPRKQKKDCQVGISSTSGVIQNVVIPAGKEAADAILTSSNVCGLVHITAKSGFQKARTAVNFAGNIAGIVLEVSPAKIPADGISISSIIIKIKDDKGNFITSLDEWSVDVTTTLGTVTSPVKIPPGTLSGIAILTSCKRVGTATVTATMGKLHSEKKVIFEELPERYCMHCGEPMKKEMNACPNCKKTPPPDTEIKECNSCSGMIPATAMFCDKCGARQPV